AKSRSTRPSLTPKTLESHSHELPYPVRRRRAVAPRRCRARCVVEPALVDATATSERSGHTSAASYAPAGHRQALSHRRAARRRWNGGGLSRLAFAARRTHRHQDPQAGVRGERGGGHALPARSTRWSPAARQERRTGARHRTTRKRPAVHGDGTALGPRPPRIARSSRAIRRSHGAAVDEGDLLRGERDPRMWHRAS